jgi:Na+-driven multidrug efflux pump
VAVGAGWQAVVAYVNIACYYVFGIPFGLLLGYKLNYGVMVMNLKSSSFEIFENIKEPLTKRPIIRKSFMC